jgi:hypothetical protein
LVIHLYGLYEAIPALVEADGSMPRSAMSSYWLDNLVAGGLRCYTGMLIVLGAE